MMVFLPRLPLILILTATTLLASVTCQESANRLGRNQMFVEPGRFDVEGFLDFQTFQFLGQVPQPALPMKAPEVGAVGNPAQTVENEPPKTGAAPDKENFAAHQYSLFMARLSAYHGLIGLKRDPETGSVFLRIPEPVYINRYLRVYDDRIPPLSFRLRKYLEKKLYKRGKIREEVIFTGKPAEGGTRYRAILHIHGDNLFQNFPQLPRKFGPSGLENFLSNN